jgi:hypothetical protein
MKKVILFLSIVLMFSFSYSQNQNKTENVKSDKLKLEVYYFHITNRCPTCISIEANTKKTIDTYFSKEVKDGTIKMIVLNVDEEKNKKISEKYGAYGSALFITRIINKKETITDVTNFAFQNSRNRPEKFIEGLKDKIIENLK